MSELVIERRFSADAETVFAYVTQTGHLLEWWGPEGMAVTEHDLDLSRPGPWVSTIVNAEGGTHKVSGVVIAVDPPRSVEFTWGWHDAEDKRGHDSCVRFEVRPGEGGGSHFRLVHTGLADDESAEGHSRGWTSTLKKLERLAV